MIRPKSTDDDVRELAVNALLARVLEWIDDPNAEVAEIRADLISEIDSFNGYVFARDLDRVHHWEGIDSELVEILDNADWDVSSAVNTLTEQWIAAYRVFPGSDIGSSATWRNYWGVHSGEITAIDHKRGTYTVLCVNEGHVRNGAGTHGYIVPWEEIDGQVNCKGLTVTGSLFEATA